MSGSDGCLWTYGWKDRFSRKPVISLSLDMVDLSDTAVPVHQHVSVSRRNNFWDGGPLPRNRSRALVRVQSNQCHLGRSLDMICLDRASGETKEEGINKTKEVGERQREIRLQRTQGIMLDWIERAGDERRYRISPLRGCHPVFLSCMSGYWSPCVRDVDKILFTR